MTIGKFLAAGWLGPTRQTLTKAHWPLCSLLYLCSTVTATADQPALFGYWTLQPQQAPEEEAIDEKRKKSKERKKYRKQRSTPQQEAPTAAVLTTKSLDILRNDTGTTITMIPARGNKLILNPDGKAAALSMSDWGTTAGNTVRFSTWEGATLVVESTPQEGTHIIHSYSVNDEGLLVQDIELFSGAESNTQQRLFKPSQHPD